MHGCVENWREAAKAVKRGPIEQGELLGSARFSYAFAQSQNETRPRSPVADPAGGENQRQLATERRGGTGRNQLGRGLGVGVFVSPCLRPADCGRLHS